MRISKRLQFIVIASTAGYLFWRWVHHTDMGMGYIGTATTFNAIIATFLFCCASVVLRSRIRIATARGCAAIAAFVIGVCFIGSMGTDLQRGPGSKEMRQRQISQENLVPGSESQWISGELLRIRREFWLTVFLTLLVACYISGLPSTDACEPNANTTGGS